MNTMPKLSDNTISELRNVFHYVTGTLQNSSDELRNNPTLEVVVGTFCEFIADYAEGKCSKEELLDKVNYIGDLIKHK